jgi:ubiquinone/menaquinone biosynthesis C-methylase UbiE
MFTKTAEFYDALYAFKDYGQACNNLHQLIQEHQPKAKSLLDIACGSGKHLTYLRNYYDVQGLDINEELLSVARRRCPDVKFHHEDMTDFNLGQSFDAVVCLFSSIGYVCTVENLNKAIQCMVDHLAPGGVLVLEPWITKEKYWQDHLAANYVDQPNLKIAWMYKHEMEDSRSIFNINYLVGTTESVESFTEQHVMGLWTEQEYREAFKKAGIAVHYDEKGLFGRGMYYGKKSN